MGLIVRAATTGSFLILEKGVVNGPITGIDKQRAISFWGSGSSGPEAQVSAHAVVRRAPAAAPVRVLEPV